VHSSAWCPIEIRVRPHLKWTITGWYSGEKRIRRFFEDKGEAETFRPRSLPLRKKTSALAPHISTHASRMAVDCHDQLAPFGKTIADATAFYVRHLEATQRSCTVDELPQRFSKTSRMTERA